MFRAQMQRCQGRRSPWTRSWALGIVLFIASAPLAAQIPGLPPGVRPTPEQARELLETRPDLVQQLRQRIQESGLTPDQVRARLRAEGYPEDLLDPYLVGGDTTRTTVPAPATLEAVRSLGLLSAESLDSLQQVDTLRSISDSDRQALDSIRGARREAARRDSLADSTTAAGRALKRFGIDVFRRATTQFQPTQTGPVDENYRLGPGDVLVLILTGDVQSTQTLQVNREGFVLIPQVGQVYAANLTLNELEDQLYTRLGRVYSGVRRGAGARTRFTVTVTRLRNIQIFVVGDVVRPGAYQVSAVGTVLTALYAAGGPTDNGSLRRVDVRRGDKLVDSIDVYDYLLRGLNRSAVRLATGDVIFVPVRGGLVTVAGRVVRPATYEIKSNETLRDVIAAAGGFDAAALPGRIQIHRILPSDSLGGGSGRIVIDVADQDLARGAVPAVPMTAGDSVTVFEVAARTRDFVTVRGNVWVEGRVGFTPGMRLSQAIRLAGGPRPDVYLGQVLVTRTRSDSTRVQLRSAFADSTGRITSDLPLETLDEIDVFARNTFLPKPYVTIVGAVRQSGRVPYREGMTLRDAVLLAGGLREDAWLDSAEVARLPPSRPTGALAETMRVPLDSSYLFRGEALRGDPPALQPYDNVLILREPGWDVQRLVAVTGQVNHPGRYALTSKTERLADLLQRAGGLTSEAYPGGVHFFRRASRTQGDVVTTGRSVQPLPPGFGERVGVDLPKALRDPKSRENLILAAGDSIHIPEYNAIVTVAGAVNAPGPVAFVPGHNADWYVDAAGGYGQTGDRKRVYVTQPDGKRETVRRRFFFSDALPKPGPGATVFVPDRKAPEQPGNGAATVGVIASLIGSLSTVIIVALTR